MFQFLLAQKPTVVTFRCDSNDMTNSLTVVFCEMKHNWGAWNLNTEMVPGLVGLISCRTWML